MACIPAEAHGENKTAAVHLGSPDTQAAPFLTATHYTLGVSCRHNETLEDYDIHPVNSETDGGVQSATRGQHPEPDVVTAKGSVKCV